MCRLVDAIGHSWAGLRAVVRHEAAFRQQVLLGVPLVAVAPWVAPGRAQALALIGVVVLVWIVELINSALEALADAVSTHARPLLGRAKDLGSAAVMLALLFAAGTWATLLWP